MQSEVHVNRRDFLYVATGTTAAVGAGFASWPGNRVSRGRLRRAGHVGVHRRRRGEFAHDPGEDWQGRRVVGRAD